MKARKRNRSAIAKKGWETRRANADAAPPVWKSRDPYHAPFHVPPVTFDHPFGPDLSTAPFPVTAADEDTAELDASNLTLRAFEGDDGTFGPTRLGPKVTMIKISGEEESFRLPPEPDPDSVETAEKLGLSVGTVKTDRSEVVDQMRIARGQEPLGPVRDRIEDELEAYKERIEKERAAERLQAQEAHAAAMRAMMERVLVQGFMGDMRGNADFKTQASHWLMNMDQAEAVFAALQRAGY